jgi:hypothetical protein
MIVTSHKTHKRKLSQQERNEKLAKKLTTLRTKRGRRQLQVQQAEEKTAVEPTFEVQRQIVDELADDWNANDADEVKREKHVPDAWKMKIADLQVGDFVVLEVMYARPAARGISVAKVGFLFSHSLEHYELVGPARYLKSFLKKRS